MERKQDGQHYSDHYYNPGTESGMKSTVSGPARVGHASGGETASSTPKPARDCMVNTTTGSAGPKAVGEITSGDDK